MTILLAYSVYLVKDYGFLSVARTGGLNIACTARERQRERERERERQRERETQSEIATSVL